MSVAENPEATEAPEEVLEPRNIELAITIHSIEGISLQTELGSQQMCASILFPSHMTDLMSPLSPPSQKVSFEFTERYTVCVYPHSTVNALLANPLEFFLYICTQDMKKQIRVAHFVFPFDDLMFHESYSCAVEGKVLPEGTAALGASGLKMNVEFSWSEPIFPPEVAEESMIASFSIGSVVSIPLAMINCSTQPNNPSTHIFTYTLASDLPDTQHLLCDEGKFTSTAADGTDAAVQFNAVRKFFVGPEQKERWKEACENDETMLFLLRPELSPLVQPLGITPEQYAALFAVAEVPLGHFAKPGRSHYQVVVPLSRDTEYSERRIDAALMSPTGFPPEPVPDTKGKKGSQRKATPLARQGSSMSKTKGTPKKPKALSAKDKKALAQLQTVMEFDAEKDYFKESTTQLKLEISLSKPILPRPATPASSKTPEEIVEPLPKMHELRLANATEEFCRQIGVAVDKLRTAKENGQDFESFRKLIKEELKPAIVDIVKQVFTSQDDDGKPQESKITEAFIAELKSFLVAHMNKTINTKFALSFPRKPPVPPEMDVEHITHRIMCQNYHHTSDLEALYLKRCQLDPLNSRWPFEAAQFYNSKGSPKAMEFFAKAIAIDYNFTLGILGFCAQLAKSGNKEDCIVLLNLLDQRKPNDPTVTVCLSILYQLIESSKTDEFLAKVSQMSAKLPKSPNITAAESLLEVHDTFLSEVMLTREQLQGQRSKELVVLLAQFTQLSGNSPRAQEYLKEAIDMDREDLSLWKMLGSYQYEAEEYDKALASFEQLLALSEEPDPEVCLKLALLHMRYRRYDKSYDLLMNTVQRLEASIAWTALGVCCLRMGDLEEAEVALCQANEMDKWDATTWGYCAVLCALMDRRLEGEQAICWASELQLRDFRLIKEIVEHYDGQCESEEAQRCLNQLKSVTEDQCHKPLEQEAADPENQGEEEEENKEQSECVE